MNSKELAKEVKKELNSLDYVFTNKEIESCIDVFIGILKEKIIDGEEVKLSNFGVFSSIVKKERIGRNPKTGEEIIIPERKMPKFRFLPSFKKEAIDNLN